MKVCQHCGETYLDFVDFCFNDGDVLVAEASALEVPEPSSLETDPAPPSRAQGSQVSRTRSATPIPRGARRSLIGRTRSSPQPVSESASEAEEQGAAAALEEPAPAAIAAAETTPPASRRTATPAPPAPQGGISQQPTQPFGRQARPGATPRRPGAGLHTAVTDDLGLTLQELRREDNDRRFLAFVLLGAAVLLFVAGGGLLMVGVGVLGSAGSGSTETDPVVPPSRQEATSSETPDPEPLPVETPELPVGEGTQAPEEGTLLAEGEELDPQAPIDPPPPEAPAVPPPQDPLARPQEVPPGPVPTPGPAPGATPNEPGRKPEAPKPPDSPWATAVGLGTMPPGATILVDGERRGVSPLRLELAPGPHMVEIRLEGYRATTRLLEVGTEELQLPTIALDKVVEEAPPAPPADAQTPMQVTVTYSGREGHELFVDGHPKGVLPLSTPLEEGMHAFRVVGPGGEVTFTREVRRVPSGRTTVELDKP